MTGTIDPLNRDTISQGNKSPNEQHSTATAMGLSHLIQQQPQVTTTAKPIPISTSITVSPSALSDVITAAKQFFIPQQPLSLQQLQELKNSDCYFSLVFHENFIGSSIATKVKNRADIRTIENGEIISWFMKEEPSQDIRLYYFSFSAQKQTCELHSLHGQEAYSKFQEFMSSDSTRAAGVTHKQFLYMRLLNKRAFAIHELEKLETLIKTADANTLANITSLIKLAKNPTTTSLRAALKGSATKSLLKKAINNEIVTALCKKSTLTDDDIHLLLNRDLSKKQADQLVPIMRKSYSARAQRIAKEVPRLLAGWRSTDSNRQVDAAVLLRAALIIEDAATKYHTVQERVIRFLPGKKDQEYLPPVRMEFDLSTRKVTLAEKWKFFTQKSSGSIKVYRSSFDVDLDTVTTAATPVAYLQMQSSRISYSTVADIQREICFAKQLRGKRGCANLRSFCEATVRTKTRGKKQQYSLVYNKYGKDLFDIAASTTNCSFFTACEDILYGLVAHENLNIAHGDTKLENILGNLENNIMRAYISDWGFTLQGDELSSTFRNCYGTPEFTDPSMIRSGAIGKNMLKADLFATGIAFDILVRKAPIPWQQFLIDCFDSQSQSWKYNHEQIASALTTKINTHRTLTATQQAAFLTKFKNNSLSETDVIRYVANVLLEPSCEKRLFASEALELFLCLKSHMNLNPKPDAATITKSRIQEIINSLTRETYT